jgi:hypothetical protein
MVSTDPFKNILQLWQGNIGRGLALDLLLDDDNEEAARIASITGRLAEERRGLLTHKGWKAHLRMEARMEATYG